MIRPLEVPVTRSPGLLSPDRAAEPTIAVLRNQTENIQYVSLHGNHGDIVDTVRYAHARTHTEKTYGTADAVNAATEVKYCSCCISWLL